MLRRLLPALNRAPHAKLVAAEQDFRIACALLELNERIVAGERDPQSLPMYVFAVEGLHPLWTCAHFSASRYCVCRAAAELHEKWGSSPLEKLIPFANDSMTIQLSEMFQHLHDIDAGDAPVVAARSLPRIATKEARKSAAFQPSIGPSTHTNPLPTLHFQMKTLYEEQKEDALIALRHQLEARHGFALWLGPTQAPTRQHSAGLYLRGTAAPGSVVGLYPGAAFNAEMLQKAEDVGHMGNSAIQRMIVPRFDECVIDCTAADVPQVNPYALAQHARHPPAGIQPNVMRIQFDFVDATAGATETLPFPQHLRKYVPNTWGAPVSTGQSLYGSLEQHVWGKGVVLIALRPLWNEELFADMTLNPFAKQAGLLPEWAENDWKARKQLRLLSSSG